MSSERSLTLPELPELPWVDTLTKQRIRQHRKDYARPAVDALHDILAYVRGKDDLYSDGDLRRIAEEALTFYGEGYTP